MNCSNCGAPFESIVQSGIAWCAYCDSRRVLSEDGCGVDGVILLGSTTDLDCPACGDQLVSAVMNDCPVRACPSCFGVAVDSDAFGQIVADRRAAYRGADRPPRLLDPRELQHERDCPVCRETMDVHPYYGPGNTVIDACRSCRLIWLDAGEMTAIEQAPGRR
ncbi:MAG: zf-TFIIB domain-containing protein [Planctomycetaceae bacterium]|nr:zf-TFIIB domain-containing protein [Planctomycetaceae bacterium]